MAIIRIPALIDPHAHLVENEGRHFRELASAALKAGYFALQLMPDLDPPITDKLVFAHYTEQIRKSPIPLYLTAVGTRDNSEALKQMKTIKAVKVWLGTGPEDLIVTKEEELRQILLSTDKVVMIHAEDENTLLKNYDLGGHELSLVKHTEIFDTAAAIRATIKAISAAKETGRRIYLCHVSTGQEIELIRQAKSKKLRVFAEVTPHHLFLTKDDTERLGTLAKVNPPLRSKEDQTALWQALNDGTIDTIGSDSYAWWQSEKEEDYENVPSGFPNLELTLPLMLTAVKQKRLSLERLIALTSTNPGTIFSIPKPTRSLFVDIDTPRMPPLRLSDWHPYEFDSLVGWPVRQFEHGTKIESPS